MKILIDADGCPVVDITIDVAKKFNMRCLLFCDTSHLLQKEGAETVFVSKGMDSVDFALVNAVNTGDLVITQDYGLAAMCLAKGAKVINQNGMIYSNANMDSLLMQRHTAKKIRMSGGKLKGMPKRTKEQDKEFRENLLKLL